MGKLTAELKWCLCCPQSDEEDEKQHFVPQHMRRPGYSMDERPQRVGSGRAPSESEVELDDEDEMSRRPSGLPHRVREQHPSRRGVPYGSRPCGGARPPVPDIPTGGGFQWEVQGKEILTDKGATRECCGDGSCSFSLCGEIRGCGARGCGAPDVWQRRDIAFAPVTMHVYYVGNSKRIKGASVVIQDILGGGGVFHGAIEVYGREWSYGGRDEGTGVFSVPPRCCDMHTYRESIYMGDCKKSEEEVFAILRPMVQQWQGRQYQLLKHNCVSFSREFCLQLGVGEIPPWTYALAETALAVLGDKEKQTVQGLQGIDTHAASANEMFG